MSSIPVQPIQPKAPFSWADDEEDDFDFETWKANVDTSAPTICDLPPLQIPLDTSEGDEAYEETILEMLRDLSDDREECLIPDTVDARGFPDFKIATYIQVQHAAHVLTTHALKEAPALPAYPELSTETEFRSSYASSWLKMKEDRKLNSRYPTLFKISALSTVTAAVDVDADNTIELKKSLLAIIEGNREGEIERSRQRNEIEAQDLWHLDTQTTADADEQEAQDQQISLFHSKATAYTCDPVIQKSGYVTESTDIYTALTDEGYASSSYPSSPETLHLEAEDREEADDNHPDHIYNSSTLSPTYQVAPQSPITTSLLSSPTLTQPQTTILTTSLPPPHTPSPLHSCKPTHPIRSNPTKSSKTLTSPSIPSPDTKYITPRPTLWTYITGSISAALFALRCLPRLRIGVAVVGAVVSGVVSMCKG